MFCFVQEIELSEAFDLMDTSKHNAIDTRDFKLVLKALGLELSRGEYIQLISKLKKDQNGFIKKETFVKEVRNLLPRRDICDDMIKAFQLIDEEDKGKINFDNLKKVADVIGEQVSDQEIINMIDAADDDRDGQVNLKEFIKLIVKARNLL